MSTFDLLPYSLHPGTGIVNDKAIVEDDIYKSGEIHTNSRLSRLTLISFVSVLQLKGKHI